MELYDKTTYSIVSKVEHNGRVLAKRLSDSLVARVKLAWLVENTPVGSDTNVWIARSNRTAMHLMNAHWAKG